MLRIKIIDRSKPRQKDDRSIMIDRTNGDRVEVVWLDTYRVIGAKYPTTFRTAHVPFLMPESELLRRVVV